jgi:hypothetical protein
MTRSKILSRKRNTKMHVEVTERRIDGKIRLMRLAGMACAIFAAAGIAHGMHEANPAGGWLVPAFAGLVAASALAIFWHVVIGAVVGMVRLSTIIALFVAATLITLVALGASAQAIATAVAGRAALSAELSARVDEFNQSLADAYAEATGWGSIAGAAAAKAAGLRLQAESESTGSNGTGKGCGPRCNSLRDIAGAFENAHHALNQLLANAADQRKVGEAAMAELRDAAAHGDQNGFMAGAEKTAQVVAELNAIDPRPIIVNTGAVTTTDKGIDLTKETVEFQAAGEKALADRQSVKTPVFTPMSLGEATRRQAFGSAMHGWILAGAIDVLPLFFLILAFVFSREVWLNEAVVRVKKTSAGKVAEDTKRVAEIMGRSETVVPFRSAAE